MSTELKQEIMDQPEIDAKLQGTLITSHFMHEMKASTDAESFEKARQTLYAMGIKTSYDETRIIFSTMQSHKTQLANAYAQECNGLILERGTWKPLMVPPRSLRFNIDTNQSNKYLHQGLYNVYLANDGTCFNMYWHNDTWCISTAKGYAMNDMKWDGKTYQELITECLAQMNISWDTFTSKLNKNSCYSFGFKHPQFHRFGEGLSTPIYRVWFIQSVNTDIKCENYLWATDESPIPAIQGQTPYCKSISSLQDLYKRSAIALDAFFKTGDVCYGFILRSVNFEVTGYHSDLFIESALLRQIRRIWYENNIIKYCHANQHSKEKVITLNAFLDNGVYEVFLRLFPQYIELFRSYSDVVQQIVTDMINNSRNTTQAATPTAVSSTSANRLTAIELAAHHALTLFTEKVKYNLENKTDDQKRRVFSEFLTSHEHFELLLGCIN